MGIEMGPESFGGRLLIREEGGEGGRLRREGGGSGAGAAPRLGGGGNGGMAIPKSVFFAGGGGGAGARPAEAGMLGRLFLVSASKTSKSDPPFWLIRCILLEVREQTVGVGKRTNSRNSGGLAGPKLFHSTGLSGVPVPISNAHGILNLQFSGAWLRSLRLQCGIVYDIERRAPLKRCPQGGFNHGSRWKKALRGGSLPTDEKCDAVRNRRGVRHQQP